MATVPRSPVGREVDYPTSDGKPMAETDVHRDLMMDLIQTLEARHAADPMVYVSGNILLFYEEGNGRRHVSPDVFVVRGISKQRREHYLIWAEDKAPDLVIELTSKSTRSEDVKKKMALYRDVLRIPEYFLFDPFQDYLKPSMQGYRLVEGRYESIGPVEGRLPSAALGLHLERAGVELRLYNPLDGPAVGCRRRTSEPRPNASAPMDPNANAPEAEHQRAGVERQRADRRTPTHRGHNRRAFDQAGGGRGRSPSDGSWRRALRLRENGGRSRPWRTDDDFNENGSPDTAFLARTMVVIAIIARRLPRRPAASHPTDDPQSRASSAIVLVPRSGALFRAASLARPRPEHSGSASRSRAGFTSWRGNLGRRPRPLWRTSDPCSRGCSSGGRSVRDGGG